MESMRVRCITTIIDNPCPSLRNAGWWKADLYLTVGKEYEVYAIHSSWILGIEAYLVCDDNYNDKDYSWPIYIPTCFFEIIDFKKPSFWCFSSKDPDYEGPPELSPDKYESLVEGEPNAISSFRRLVYLSN